MTQHTAEDRRSGPDVASLLVELGRLLRSYRFYGEGHPRLAESFRRTIRAFQAELDRAGSLDLRVAGGSFQFEGARLAPYVLDEVAGELEQRGFWGVRLRAPLDPDAFAAFVQLASMDPDALRREGGPQQALQRRLIEGIEVEEAPAQEPRGDDGRGPVETGTLEDGPDDPADTAPLWADSTEPVAAHPVDEDTTPTLGFAPEKTAFDDLLQEFEECEESATYARLADRIVEAADQAARTGRLDEAHGAILAARNHAGAEAKRNEHQRSVSAAMLGRLLSGPILADVLERACSDDPGESVQASSLLLQGSDAIVPSLLDALDRTEDPLRCDRLRAVLLAMGERAAQPLLDAIRGQDRRLARTAVRLCGDLQHPLAVEWLEDLVAGSEPLLRQEAVMALARIAGQASLDALLRVLDSPVRDVRILAAQALGASGRPRAAVPLAKRVERNLETGDLELAREAIRALGRLGRPEAAPTLAAVLARRRLFGRGKLRELKLATVAALGRIPGEPATQALTETARTGDAGLRRAAKAALRRREPDDPRAAKNDGDG